MLKIAWCPAYAHPLPENHRFPMEKYELLPKQLMLEGTVSEDNFFTPEPIEESLILEVHDVQYWRKLKDLDLSKTEIRKTGFPLSRELVNRETTIAGGTIACCEYALIHGAAMNVAGGTHHAFTDRGEGFCLLNDIALGANYLLNQKKIKQVLVVDLDVHQGNGTAQIFRGEHRVFTFSMHGANNYPLQKEESDLDIALPDGTDDAAFLSLLSYQLAGLVDKLRPDFIFYQSGVDVLATDKLGRLGLSLSGCAERDRLVIQTCYEKGIPWVAVMGGGYSERLTDIIEAHANTYRVAASMYE